MGSSLFPEHIAMDMVIEAEALGIREGSIVAVRILPSRGEAAISLKVIGQESCINFGLNPPESEGEGKIGLQNVKSTSPEQVNAMLGLRMVAMPGFQVISSQLGSQFWLAYAVREGVDAAMAEEALKKVSSSYEWMFKPGSMFVIS